MSYRTNGCPYGSHRVLEPKGFLPQPAFKLDNSLPIYDNEILIDVITLNIDSASFHQMKSASNNSPDGIAKIIMETVAERGKQHNKVTGSGGMLIGKIKDIGPNYKGKLKLKIGDRVATLVSLSLTPLYINSIKNVIIDKEQVEIDGYAILFESGVAVKLPDDIPEKIALAALDVAGAPAQTAHLVKGGDTVLVIGAGGKSGMLCLYEAKKKVGRTGKVIGLAHSDTSFERMKRYGFADICLKGNAQRPLEVYEMIKEHTDGKMCDLVINCTNVPNTEMSSILSCKESGTVYFFSMATSFTAAALGAEGIGHGATMLIGNGYFPNHAEYTFSILRESKELYHLFEELYG